MLRVWRRRGEGLEGRLRTGGYRCVAAISGEGSQIGIVEWLGAEESSANGPVKGRRTRRNEAGRNLLGERLQQESGDHKDFGCEEAQLTLIFV